MARRKSRPTSMVTRKKPQDDPEPDWTPDELAEPHDCPGCSCVIFADAFCDDQCRTTYLAGDGYLSLEEGPKLTTVLQGMDGPVGIATRGARVDDVPGPEDLAGLEGEARKHFVVHRAREQRLRVAKIREALARDAGQLRCEVPRCGFDFAETYGRLGRAFAHVHHLKPLGARGSPSATRLSELAIVCANCHAMIHRGGKSRGLKALIPPGGPEG